MPATNVAVSLFSCAGVLRTLRRSQCTIPCRCDTEGGFEHPAEMRLVSETDLQGHFDQISALGELFAGKVKTPHEQIAVGAGSTHDAKLPGQFVAGEAGHCLQLRGMNNPRFLCVKILASTFQGGHIKMTRKGGLLTTGIGLQQPLRQLYDEIIYRQRFAGALKGADDRGRQFPIYNNGHAYKWQRAGMRTHALERFKNQSRFYIDLDIQSPFP